MFSQPSIKGKIFGYASYVYASNFIVVKHLACESSRFFRPFFHPPRGFFFSAGETRAEKPAALFGI